MSYLSFLISACIVICMLIDNSFSFANYLDICQSRYGPGYGIEWLYFPDPNGVPHYIDLTMSRDEILGNVSLGFNNVKIPPNAYRLYTGDVNSYILLDNHGRAQDERQQEIVTRILQSTLPLKVLTHGWISTVDAISEILKAYLQFDKNVNVISVDWSNTASSYNYFWVAYQTSTVGSMIAEFLDELNTQYGVTGDQLHLIGHSLGAHVVGIAAANTKRDTYRVTGLDPARPFFEWPANTFVRLTASDAKIVDVIHTCGGLLGFKGAIGTVDFFPNAGLPPQPGCDDFCKLYEGCSHAVSIHYFSESIKNPRIYPAYKCDSWLDFLTHNCNGRSYMGEPVSGMLTGKYYLRNNGTQSFNFGR